MKKFFILLAILFFSAVAFAEWKYNPFTGKLDYYEPTGGGGASSLAVEENDVQISSPTASIDFRDGLDVTESPTGEANVVVDPDEVITAGTNISWSGHTLNVDDAFLSNSADDSTNYQITVSSLVVTNKTTLNSSLSGLAKLTAGVVSAITDNSSNWNTAYGWGNHAVAGYLTSAPTSFLLLNDTPASYSGQAGKYAKVNSGETALEFDTPGGAGDMLKATYDTNANDIVDNSEALGGYAYTYFLSTTTADSTYLTKSSATATYQLKDADLDDLADGTLSKSKVEDSGNWDSAYGWGDHSIAGYITETDSGVVTFSNLQTNGGVGLGDNQVAYATHTHTGVYEPADSQIMKEGENVSLLTNDSGYLISLATGTITQPYDADLDDLADGTLSASKIEDKFLRNYEDDTSNYKITLSSLAVTNQTTLNASLTGLAKLTSGVISAVTDNSTNWDTAYTHSQNNNQAHTDYLKNDADDTTSYKITMSSISVTNNASVGSLSSSGQVTSNARKLVDEYDFGVSFTTSTQLHTGTAYLVSLHRSFAHTISTCTAQTDSGTVVFMLEQRTLAGSNSAGTDLWTSDVTVSSTTWTGGTFNDNTLPAGSGLYLIITSITGTPDNFRIIGVYTKD